MTEVGITQFGVERLWLDFGSADPAVRAKGSKGTPLTGVDFNPPIVFKVYERELKFTIAVER